MSQKDDSEMLTKIATTLWGPFGTNGLNGDLKSHSKQIGELFARDETLREDVNDRLAKFEQRMNDKLDGLYKLVASVGVTILLGAAGIIVSLLTGGP